jgi:hypothetical protein
MLPPVMDLIFSRFITCNYAWGHVARNWPRFSSFIWTWAAKLNIPTYIFFSKYTHIRSSFTSWHFYTWKSFVNVLFQQTCCIGNISTYIYIYFGCQRHRFKENMIFWYFINPYNSCYFQVTLPYKAEQVNELINHVH